MRNENIEQHMEQTLHSAGNFTNSGEIAKIIWLGLEQICSPVYRYTDEDGVVWFGDDPEAMCDSFGCELTDLQGGYFLPAKP